MTQFSWNELIPMQAELVLCIAAIVLLVFGVLRGDRSTRMVALGSVLALLMGFYFLAHAPSARALVMHGMFLSDAFTIFVKMLVLLGTLLVLVISFDWLKREEHARFEFPILVLLAALGMMLMVSANDFTAVYVGMELSSLSLYVLAAFRRDNLKSTEAGLKYFVLGALASGMMLFGISLVYGFAGATSFEALHALFAKDAVQVAPGLVVGLVLVMIGFCFKISAAPFHMWTPDVYEGAPTPVTALFSVAPKIAALALFARVLMQPFEALAAQWQGVIVMVSVATMLVGALGAITQKNIKRLLAYSSIGHVGYALVGLVAGSTAGVQGMLIYLALYLFMSVGAFACVLLMQRQGEYVEDIAALAGMSRTRPRLAFLLAVFMFSMAGIPPLSGFFGKMYVFLPAIQAGFTGLAVIGVLTSVVACYYYLNIVKLMYFDAPVEPFDAHMRPSMRLTLLICVGVTLLYVVLPTPLIVQARAAAEALGW